MDFILNLASLVFVAFIVYGFTKDMRRSLSASKRMRNSEKRIKRIRLGLERCYGCDGSGYIPEFSNVSDGICFVCSGHSKYGNYGSLRRREEAVKSRNEHLLVHRSKYLEERARYYELLSAYHLEGILGRGSKIGIQDDEIAIIKMVLNKKLKIDQDQSSTENK